MNLNQFRFACALATTHSFSRAAEQCHVTQPTLSNGVAQLEEKLGGRLFERTTRSVRLTPFGQHLLPFITRALSDVEEVQAAASAWRDPEHKLIRVGLSPVINMRLLLDVLAPFRAAHPDVEFFFKECFLDDLDERLHSGQLDMVFLPRRKRPQGQAHLDFYTEPLCYLPRDGGPLAGTDGSICLEEAAGDSLVLTLDGCGLRDVTLNLFRGNDLTIRKYPGQATSYAVVEDWASLGIGAAILPRSKVSASNPNVRPLLLTSGKAAVIVCEAVWNPNVVGIEHVRALIEHMKTFARGTVEACVA